jgi:predicted DsbA family dithiol-disulfide isomerase
MSDTDAQNVGADRETSRDALSQEPKKAAVAEALAALQEMPHSPVPITVVRDPGKNLRSRGFSVRVHQKPLIISGAFRTGLCDVTSQAANFVECF